VSHLGLAEGECRRLSFSGPARIEFPTCSGRADVLRRIAIRTRTVSWRRMLPFQQPARTFLIPLCCNRSMILTLQWYPRMTPFAGMSPVSSRIGE